MIEIMDTLRSLYKLKLASPENVSTIASEYAKTKDIDGLCRKVGAIETETDDDYENLMWVLERLWNLKKEKQNG